MRQTFLDSSHDSLYAYEYFGVQRYCTVVLVVLVVHLMLDRSAPLYSSTSSLQYRSLHIAYMYNVCHVLIVSIDNFHVRVCHDLASHT